MPPRPDDQSESLEVIDRVYAAALSTRSGLRAVAATLSVCCGLAALGWAVASGTIAALGLPELIVLVTLLFAPPLDAACSHARRIALRRAEAQEVRAAAALADPTIAASPVLTEPKPVPAVELPTLGTPPARLHADTPSRWERRRRRREAELFEDPADNARIKAFTPLPDDLRVPDLSEVTGREAARPSDN